MTGIEPAYPAWEAGVLPMNYIRVEMIIAPLARIGKWFLAAGIKKAAARQMIPICFGSSLCFSAEEGT